MLRGLGVLFIMALLVAATIGLAGGGPPWLRYVGSGTLFLLLMLILTQTSNLPDKVEFRRMFGQGEDEGEELFSAEPIIGAKETDGEDLFGKN